MRGGTAAPEHQRGAAKLFDQVDRVQALDWRVRVDCAGGDDVIFIPRRDRLGVAPKILILQLDHQEADDPELCVVAVQLVGGIVDRDQAIGAVVNPPLNLIFQASCNLAGVAIQPVADLDIVISAVAPSVARVVGVAAWAGAVGVVADSVWQIFVGIE